MGLRGPVPKPNAVREREGMRGHRPLAKEPQYAAGVPEKPKKISARARVIWDELVGEMAGANILRTVDQRALWQLAEDEALLAEAYSGIWRYARELAVEAKAKKQKIPGGALFGLLGMKSGRMAVNSISHIAARAIIQRREFGLTPSARTRFDEDFGIPPKQGSANKYIDPLEAALCGDDPPAPVN